MKESIVITGMGAVTPLGLGVRAFWKGLVEGKSGIHAIHSFDSSDLAVQIAGEVKDFNPGDHMPIDLVRKTDPFMQFAYIAAEEALRDSKLTVEPENTGITMGTAMSGIATIAYTQEALTGASHKKVGPRFIPKILGNIAAAHIAITHNIQGPSLTVSTACASGGDAVSAAADCLRLGRAEVMLAVGAESVLCPLVVYSLANAKALSRNNEDPAHASRPFDAMRDGFVIGEGGGALVLETEAHAVRRGATIYARLMGCGNGCDAYHITAPQPEGVGAARCMELALKDAGLKPEQIGYINAHGTATPKGDAAETLAIKRVFGEHIPLVSSTKGATGHMMGAGGITELIACIQAIRTGLLSPTINLEHPDPDCDLDYIPLQSREKKVDYAMSNAFGFGGQNSSVIVGRWNS